MKKNSLIARVAKLAFSIFINKPIGLIRDIFRIQYFGVGLIADSFSMAWRIPNSLRKILAEGALSSALVPTLVEAKEKHGNEIVSEITTLTSLFLNIITVILCIIIAYFATPIIAYIAPGAIERVAYAAPLLKILIFFTMFMSVSTAIGCSFQAINKFAVGPISQFFLNIALIIQFFLCIKWQLSVTALSWMILFNGLIILFIHVYVYRQNKFIFTMPTKKSLPYFKAFLKKLLPALFGVGISEINLFIDQAVASYLPTGSQSMFDYIGGFIRIPLQVIGSAFATVSTPHFAKVALKNPKRLGFYLLESAKLLFWVSVPATLCFYAFSYKGLYTLLLSDKFTLDHVIQGARLLSLFSIGIFFTTYNRTAIGIFYAKHNTKLPTILTFFTSALNTILNIALIGKLKLFGIVSATVLSEIIRSILFTYALHTYLDIKIYYKKFFIFIKKSLTQLTLISSIAFTIYKLFNLFIKVLFPLYWQNILLNTLATWIWIGPIVLLSALIALKTKKHFQINLFYLK